MDLMAILWMAFVLATIAVIVMIVKAEEEPKTAWIKANWKIHFKVFVYSFITGAFFVFVLSYDPTQPNDYVSVLGVAYLGISGIAALISRLNAKTEAA